MYTVYGAFFLTVGFCRQLVQWLCLGANVFLQDLWKKPYCSFRDKSNFCSFAL